MTDPKPHLQDERIAHLMRLAARGFNRSLSLRLSEHGVTFGHWVFLRILWIEDGLSQRELAGRANLTEPTTHTALLRMESLGYVDRRQMAGNRRRQHAFLTARGRDLRALLEPLAVATNDAALAGLAPDRRTALRDALLRVLDNLDRDEAEAGARGMKVPPTRLNSDV